MVERTRTAYRRLFEVRVLHHYWLDDGATTFDDSDPHPLTEHLTGYLRSLPWVSEAECRVRDQGQFFHVEAFVVPPGERSPSPADLEAARDACRRIDWKAHDVVIVPVSELPSQLTRQRSSD